MCLPAFRRAGRGKGGHWLLARSVTPSPFSAACPTSRIEALWRSPGRSKATQCRSFRPHRVGGIASCARAVPSVEGSTRRRKRRSGRRSAKGSGTCRRWKRRSRRTLNQFPMWSNDHGANSVHPNETPSGYSRLSAVAGQPPPPPNQEIVGTTTAGVLPVDGLLLPVGLSTHHRRRLVPS
jgi:hypothetical protein